MPAAHSSSTTGSPPDVFDLDAAFERVLDDIERYELAESSVAVYASQWTSFERWCINHELDALPAAPATLQLYLVELAGATLDEAGIVHLTRRARNLDTHVAAIRWMHRKAGHLTPTGDKRVRALLKVLTTAEQPAARKARPVTVADLELIATTAPDYPTFERCWTAMLVGFFGCFRGSEVVALRIEHITFHLDGMVVFVPKSKGDPTGRGEWVGIARRPDQPICPVRQLEKWVEGLDATTGWVFPSPRKPGDHINMRTLSNDISTVCGHVFEDVARYTTHSLRRGYCTSAAEAGHSLLSIALKARHKSCATTVGYVDTKPNDAVNAVAAALGA